MVTDRILLLVFQEFFFLILYFSTDNFTFFTFQIAIPTYLGTYHFFALWWARNNFGVIFSFVYTVFTFTCRLRRPAEGVYFKFYYSQAF